MTQAHPYIDIAIYKILNKIQITNETHQKDLDGSQDVHGSSEGGAQVETQAHRPPKLWTQRATDHEVGSSRWRG